MNWYTRVEGFLNRGFRERLRDERRYGHIGNVYPMIYGDDWGASCAECHAITDGLPSKAQAIAWLTGHHPAGHGPYPGPPDDPALD